MAPCGGQIVPRAATARQQSNESFETDHHRNRNKENYDVISASGSYIDHDLLCEWQYVHNMDMCRRTCM